MSEPEVMPVLLWQELVSDSFQKTCYWEFAGFAELEEPRSYWRTSMGPVAVITAVLEGSYSRINLWEERLLPEVGLAVACSCFRTDFATVVVAVEEQIA